MDKLLEISRQKVLLAPDEFNRYLLMDIDTNRQLTGIKGARGSGKTTLLLQLLKNKKTTESLYVSLDNIHFATNSLFDLAYEFNKRGGKYLYLDEVHKYPSWSQEIKNVYDSFDQLKIVFTSSSALEINKGKYDLSRRALILNLYGLSFREFVKLKYKIYLPVLSLDDILFNHEEISVEVLKSFKPYKYFEEYLKSGYYPFFVKEKEFYHQQLLETINLVLETDLPVIYNIDYNSIIKLKKLLSIIGKISPYKPNLSKLANQIGTTRDSLLKYLHLLHNAHIITWLSSDAHGINFLNKPDKLYLHNTNISYSFNSEVNIGSIRETFILNQLKVNHNVTYPKTGDFLIDEKYLFEVGGKHKTQKQIAGIEDSFIITDNVETSYGNKIPIWLFGLMY